MAVNILLKRSATASKRPVGASMAFGELNLNYDAATGGLFYKDSLGAVVKVGPCQVSATAPNSSPAGSSGNSAGEFWYDTSSNTLKVFNGTAWVESGGSVDSVSGSGAITVNNADPLNPVVGISAASTTAPGAVQLNDTTSSSSTTEALTANQGKNLQEQINALSVSSNLTLAGTLDASTGDLVTVTTEGAAQGFVVGDPLPSPAAGNAEFFVIATTGAASYTPPGGSAVEVHVGDWFLSSGTVWNFLDVGFQAAYASTTTAGIVQLATDAEVQTGVNTDRAVVPSSLQSKISDSVSTTSSTTIASSTAVKSAYDAGVQGQTDAAAAQADADQALLDAAAAQATADQAVLDAAAAQTTANQAVFNAGAAQSSANAAQVDATQALSNAAAAQATANAAMPRSGGTFTNNVTFSAGPGLGIITSFGTITPGSGYPPGVYSGVTLIGGSGVAAVADVTVGLSGGVTAVDLIDGGIDYTVGDVLTSLIVDGGGWSVVVATTSAPVGAVFQIDSPSTLLNNGFSVFNGGATFNDQVNIGGMTSFFDTSETYFDPGSTIGFNGDAEVNGTFTFNTAPVFPSGVDIGAAAQVTYDNATSGLSATEVQGAIDEIVAEYVPNASFTAAGDLLVGSGAGTYAALPAGAADYILASDGVGGLNWVPQSEGDVTGVTGTAPITVDNTDPQNPIVGINAASTSAAGAVQLNDTVTSTSTSEAATANAVKTAYDAAVTAQATNPFAADNVLFVNTTDGNNATAARGTARPYSTLTAALAAASEGDFIYISAGTLTENVVINKGVTIQGTYQDQGTWQGTKILGNAQINLSGSVTRNLSINNVYFISANSTPVLRVVAHATGAGNTIISNCGFTQQTATDVNQFAYSSDAVNWTRAIYMRNCLLDGNVKHNAGTAAGASGYLVFDGTIGSGSSNFYYQVLTGTVEFRSPTNALSPIYQTGGVVTTRNVTAWTNNSATTTTIFGGTGFNYKGSAASVGTGTIYFGGGYNTVGGKVDIGANLVYGWSNLNVTPANLTVNGSAVAYTTAVPASAGVVVAQQTRPRYDLLTTTSSVAAANQLGTVIDSSTGTFYSVTAYDAGTY